MLWVTIILINGAGFVGSMPSAGTPENITVMFMSPSSVRVSWTTAIEQVDKYDVTYKPTDASYRVVAVVAGNSDSVTLTGLMADTQYQITVTAVCDGRRYKSRPIVFRTLEPPRANEVQLTPRGGGAGGSRPVPPLNMPPTYIQVRGVEVGIVVLVLMVWVAAIILFFNRWGKIRMLLPYQPDYKEAQLKVPGTGACAAAAACQPQAGNAFCCSQPNNLQEEVLQRQDKQDIFDTQRHLHRWRQADEATGWRARLSRARINSAACIGDSAAECEALMGGDDGGLGLRRAKSAGNLMRDRRWDSEFQRDDVELLRQDSEPPTRLELPVLSISIATETAFVEQHL